LKIVTTLKLGFAGLALTSLVSCGGTKSIAGLGAAAPHAKWTILVYLNAANDLDAYSTVNVSQMEQAAFNPQVRFVVQWKQSTSVTNYATFNGTRRYLIEPSAAGVAVNKLVQDMGTGVDMGIPQTLNEFIAWGQANYPADHYVVVLWDHGNGWLPEAIASKKPPAFSYDSQTGHAIQIWQLNQAYSGRHVDITAFDASLMQMDEVAYQLMGYTDFVAGSEESPPGAGYPYQRVFAEFAINPDASPRTLSKAFVDGMLSEPSYDNDKIEQSVVDTSQMSGVANAAGVLGQAMVANSAALAPIIPGLRSTVQSYLPTTNRFFFDSVDLCNQLSAGANIGAVQSACAAYTAAAGNAIVWEGHNSYSPGSHGLSIDFSPGSFYTTVSSSYNQLAWENATDWGQWLAIAP
jgi:hypothetical protein